MAHVTRAAPPHTDLPHLTGRTRSPFIPFLGEAPCPRAVPGALLWGYRLSHTGGASKVRGSIGPPHKHTYEPPRHRHASWEGASGHMAQVTCGII